MPRLNALEAPSGLRGLIAELARDLSPQRRHFLRRALCAWPIDRHLGEWTRVGLAESRKSRSARPIASSTSCVTRSVVTGRLLTNSASSSRRRAAERIVERHERLVEQQQIGLDRKRARQRHAPRQSKREFARKMIAMRIEPERGKSASRLASLASGAASRTFCSSGPPGQQPRLLKYHRPACSDREADAPFIFPVEPGDDAQQRGLATARGTNQAHRPRRCRAANDRRVETRSSPAEAERKDFCLDARRQAVLGRQRVTCRSSGCTRSVSITSMTATKVRA